MYITWLLFLLITAYCRYKDRSCIPKATGSVRLSRMQSHLNNGKFLLLTDSEQYNGCNSFSLKGSEQTEALNP